jgi:RHH-type proline utilization regulon transcriptional repressor/proline dehydrogenase/delta 1-pyrroline-5-carboxylate dehydrogenase
MRFDKLPAAIAIVNQTGYGLTSGLESLDEREWVLWRRRIHAGNLYINRVTTGAVVLRQPFGGMGKSVFGPGMKAGGPNYVAQFMDFIDRKPRAREEFEPLFQRVFSSYQNVWETEFSQAHDHFRLLGQDNFRDYAALGDVLVRVHPDDSPFEIFGRACAARVTGNHVTISSPRDFRSTAIEALDSMTESWAGGIEFLEQSNEELAEALRENAFDRIRYAAPERVPEAVARAAGPAGARIVSAPVVSEGRLECLWCLRERSTSIDYHRYGNLGVRAAETRAGVA